MNSSVAGPQVTCLPLQATGQPARPQASRPGKAQQRGHTCVDLAAARAAVSHAPQRLYRIHHARARRHLVQLRNKAHAACVPVVLRVVQAERRSRDQTVRHAYDQRIAAAGLQRPPLQPATRAQRLRTHARLRDARGLAFSLAASHLQAKKTHQSSNGSLERLGAGCSAAKHGRRSELTVQCPCRAVGRPQRDMSWALKVGTVEANHTAAASAAPIKLFCGHGHRLQPPREARDRSKQKAHLLQAAARQSRAPARPAEHRSPRQRPGAQARSACRRQRNSPCRRRSKHGPPRSQKASLACLAALSTGSRS
jgi:hypothetical protein